jgi:hypothetical protein
MAIDLTCMCGSGKQKRALYDARGIFLTYACTDCRTRKLAGFRAEVLRDPAYQADEPIDE